MGGGPQCSKVFKLMTEHSYCFISTPTSKSKNCTSWLQDIFGEEIECGKFPIAKSTGMLNVLDPNSCFSKRYHVKGKNETEKSKIEFDTNLGHLILSLEFKERKSETYLFFQNILNFLDINY